MVRLALLLALLAPAAALGQPPAGSPDPARAAPGLTDSVRVSLLTMLPGEEVYSLFGHSALRVRDDAAGVDRTYNFGTFDFGQPLFLLRFARGQLDYQLSTAPFGDLLYAYQLAGRPVIEQTLGLPPETARALYALLETNALPENRTYRYDFFWDNCSTRLLDVVDAALRTTGRPAVVLPPTGTPRTFRQLLAPYIQGTPTVALGMNLGLGSPTDRTATSREETFLPLALAAQLDRATVGGSPLVARRDTLFWAEGAGAVPDRTAWVPLLVALALAGLYAASRWRPLAGRVADGVLYAGFGVAGLALLFLWVATDHDVTRPNLNLAWLWPTHLAVAVAAARGGVGAGWRRYLWVYVGVSVAAVGVSLLGLQSLPLDVWPLGALGAARSAWLAARGGPGPRAAPVVA